MIRYLFRKDQRLRSNSQFRSVLARRCIVSDSTVTLAVSENGLDYPRLGVSIGRKYANAVNRNRIKRFSREVFRLNQHNIPKGYDYLLIFSPKMSKKSMEDGSARGKNVDFKRLQESFLALVDLAAKKARRTSKN